jgi:hypothetical protein
MNQDPLATLGNVEMTRGGLLRGAVLMGAAALLTACTEEGKQSHDWPTQDPSAPNPAIPGPEQSALPPAEPHEGLAESGDPSLVRLGKHEKEFDTRFDSNMLFIDMPRDPEQAEAKALELAPRLKEYAKYGIKPIVIMEPTYDGGEEMIDLRKLADAKHADAYRETLEAYFRTLNWEGIADEQMGRWVLFPEPNIPTWENGVTSAEVFKRNFIPAAQALQTHFREADISVLLERKTYPDGDMDYSNGTADVAALRRYIDGIPQGLIGSIGFQGYPWDKGDKPSNFVDAKTLVDLAGRLGVDRVWLNTGTYHKAQRDGRDVVFSASERRELLEAELKQAEIARKAGREVEVVLFGENKYPEDADWSYSTGADKASLKDVLQRARRANIPVSFFDPVYS